MEERYEIRGKIGQGGLGAVYRGYDTRMNREVAIKRITTSGGDKDLETESTRQLIKEAGALASLQHPHIVTVYDVGSDEDGPYVVMELISGKTLDELIERAPLTWPDFRELAMQTQEALIAAQELDLIHSDIKPSNLMLSWLPSGKFQVKIVDFGLATLAQSQSKQDLEELEAVFGSIYFMAPEQFERIPVDARSDLYSMGCVYYHALTGVYPFDGRTGHEVMTSHLNHAVTPLQELRSDIPLWVCDWIMWHINRQPQDRPESARQALSVFFQNDKNPNPTMSLGAAQGNTPRRPRLIIPGSNPAPTTATPTQAAVPVAVPVAIPVATPVPAAPPPLPEPATASVPIAAAIVASLPADPVDVAEPSKSKTAPQPLTPPEGSKPSVHTAPQEIPEIIPVADPVPVVPLARPAQTVAMAPPSVGIPTPPVVKKQSRGLSNAAKTTIAAILALLVILVGWVLLDRSGRNRETKAYNEMITEAAKGDATEVLVNKVKLDILLEAAANTGVNEHRQTIYKALFLAKATDGTDVDARIAEFATRREMLPDVREVLIRDVLRKRKNPSVVPTLMAFARSTSESRAAVAALQAVRFMAGDDQIEPFISVIETTSQEDIRKAAEDTLAEIIRKTRNRTDCANRLATSYESAVNDNIRQSLLRLLGRCGGDKALEIVKKALADEKDQVAAIVALGGWHDDSAFSILLDFIASAKDPQKRGRAFDAALKFVSDPVNISEKVVGEKQWSQLVATAKTRGEQEGLIRGLVNFDDPWAEKLIENYAKSDDDKVANLAEKALDHMRERKRASDGGK